MNIGAIEQAVGDHVGGAGAGRRRAAGQEIADEWWRVVRVDDAVGVGVTRGGGVDGDGDPGAPGLVVIEPAGLAMTRL